MVVLKVAAVDLFCCRGHICVNEINISHRLITNHLLTDLPLAVVVVLNVATVEAPVEASVCSVAVVTLVSAERRRCSVDEGVGSINERWRLHELCTIPRFFVQNIHWKSVYSAI